MFQSQKPSIPQETSFYLELAQDLGFLKFWELDGDILTLTFYEGTQMYFDALSSCTMDFLKEQVEFFADAIQFPYTICNWSQGLPKGI